MTRPALIFIATVVLSLVAEAKDTASHMVLISGGSLRVGGDTEDMVTAAARCLADLEDGADQSACDLDRFSPEVGPDEQTYIKAFFLDRTEVTLGSYLRCVRARRCRAPGLDLGAPAYRNRDLPAVFVSQSDAINYCAYVRARLPTEGEFERASRGLQRRNYPWGKFFRWGLANAGSSSQQRSDLRDGAELLAPAHSFVLGASPEGVLQLSGNAAEWTSSAFLPHGTASGAESEGKFVVKGGSFADAPAFLRGSARTALPGTARRATVGFRCARDAAL